MNMFRRRFENIWPVGVVALVFGLLPPIAFYQYRWIGRVSEAERDRLRSLVQSAAMRLADDFDEELTRAIVAIHGRGGRFPPGQPPFAGRERPTIDDCALRYVEWLSATSHPQLVKAFWAVRFQEDLPQLLAFDASRERFEPAAWPPRLESLRVLFHPDFGPGPPLIVDEEVLAMIVPVGARIGFGAAAPGFRRSPRPREMSERDEPPADRRRRPRRLDELTIIELDPQYLTGTLLPALIVRHFKNAGFEDFDVDIVSRREPAKVVYHWGPDAAPGAPGTADVAVGLLAVRPELLFGSRAAGSPEETRMPQRLGERGRWEMRVRHRSGSLASVVGQARRRNLAISSSVLVLIVAAMLALAVAAHRARQLAREQVEFAAGVSHELRTPLSVIRSAADNLADGLVTDTRQVRKYGSLIGNEGRRLSDMVDEILAFSGWRSGRVPPEMKQVAVERIIEQALAAADPEIQAAGCEVERRIAANLPPVTGDDVSLQHCFRNLLSNAAKHAGSGRWIGIGAEIAPDGKQVRVSVEDRGAGIETAEMPHLFEPFYRGQRAKECQIHGAGLGLSLVKRIAEAHGGSVQVSSTPGSGAKFTVVLPAA